MANIESQSILLMLHGRRKCHLVANLVIQIFPSVAVYERFEIRYSVK